MGLILQRSAGANAPDLEEGPHYAFFGGVSAESHPEWAGPSRFGEDDGERWRFLFTVLDDNGAVLYNGDRPLTVDKLTSQSMGKKSTAYAIMSGVLTKAEREAIDAKQPVDSDSLVGRIVQIVTENNDDGWPVIVTVMPAGKNAPTKIVRPTQADIAAVDESAADEEDEEAALLAQIAAKKAAKEAKAAKPSAEDTAAAEKAARAEALRAQLAELEAD